VFHVKTTDKNNILNSYITLTLQKRIHKG